MKVPYSIAIVGVGGIFPQSAHLSQFWANVRDGVDTACEVPAGRWVLPAAEAGSAPNPTSN